MALLFAYGSLVSPASARRTLGAPVEIVAPARLRGWRRRWSTARDNLASEKTFAPADGGERFRYCLGLNLEADPGAAGPNGALLRLTDSQLARLDLRELRYRRAEVTGMVDAGAGVDVDGEVLAYVAKPAHLAPEPPPGSVILAAYLRAVESAFDGLGAGALELYRATTDPRPVDVVEGVLVEEAVPPGNPTDW